jgi:hypothetical protein
VSDGISQRHGTSIAVKDRTLVLYQVGDPKVLDARRKQAEVPPKADYTGWKSRERKCDRDMDRVQRNRSEGRPTQTNSRWIAKAAISELMLPKPRGTLVSFSGLYKPLVLRLLNSTDGLSFGHNIDALHDRAAVRQTYTGRIEYQRQQAAITTIESTFDTYPTPQAALHGLEVGFLLPFALDGQLPVMQYAC